MKTGEPDNIDLPWLAFCYVAGELSEEESARFEQRLATDQAARAAVAQAVLLGEAVVLSSNERAAGAASPSRRRSAFYGMLVLAAAAAVLLGVGMALWFGGSTPPTSPWVTSSEWEAPVPLPGGPVNSSASRMLALWSASAGEYDFSDGDWMDESGAIRPREGAFPDEAAAAFAAADAWSLRGDKEFNVPAWLLAAVSADAAAEEEPADDEK